METIETIQQHYSLGEDFLEDFGANQNLKDMVNDRVQKLSPDLNGKHFYSLNITKCPTRINYHQFSFEKLQEISRKLTNGLSTLGSIPNRKFWNKCFLGGVRTISIKQEDHKEYPSFSVSYILYSDYDNLDVRIKKQLFTRIKMIDPFIESSFEYLGPYTNSIVDEHLKFSTEVDFSSPNLLKLGENNLHDIFNNQFQRPRFFGRLFKINTKV